MINDDFMKARFTSLFAPLPPPPSSHDLQELGRLTGMKFNMALNSNSFEGGLPSTLFSMTELRGGLNLYSNQFSKTLPTQIGQLTELTVNVNIYSAGFTGPLP